MKQFKTVRCSTVMGDAFDKEIENLLNDGREIVNAHSVSSGSYGLIFDVAYLVKEVKE